MPDQSAQVAALRAGKVDLIFPSAESVMALKGSKVVIKKIQTAIIVQLEMNSEFNPALSNLKVREAIAHAIDRNAIVSKALLGAGVPSAHMPSSLKYAVRVADLPNYTFNPALSKQLLADAGYSKGLDITLDVFSTAPPEIFRFAQVIQSQLKVVGINVDIVNIPSLLADYEKLQASEVWPNLAIAAEALWVATRPGVVGVGIEYTMSRSFLTGVTVSK
jgi:peptide/nickel transport system substrate-binding protein